MPRLRSSSRMCGTAAAASSRSTVIRTISEPARESAATCATVPATSAVSVLVIDCTTIGAPPPTATLPTMTCVVLCRAWGPATSFCGGVTGWFMGSQISGFGDIHQGDGGRACLLYWNCTGGCSRSSRRLDRRARRIELSFVYSIAYPGHSDPKQGRCKEIAQDALTGILGGNFQIKVR